MSNDPVSTFLQIAPESFIHQPTHEPEHGRGAWTRAGIGDDYRYHHRKGVAVGNEAEKSLDHWAVSAAVEAIQQRLVALGHLAPRPERYRGTFGSATRRAVMEFQRHNVDPEENRRLEVDGTVGRADARSLWTPVIDRETARARIPDRLLRGLLNHESRIDPGALGFYIYYQQDDGSTRYGGVDRGIGQVNSQANPQLTWLEAFRPWTAIEWSATRLRRTFAGFKLDYPAREDAMVWDAAVCAHNSPARARDWLENGRPSAEAAAYVAAVKAARY